MEVLRGRWNSSEGVRSPRGLGALQHSRSDIGGASLMAASAAQPPVAQRRRSSSFQVIKQQLLSSSQPPTQASRASQGPPTHAEGRAADHPADLTEQMRKFGFKEAAERDGGGPPASAASSRFPFSCGQPQKPLRRGRSGASEGAHTGGLPAAAAAACSSGEAQPASRMFGSAQQQQQQQQQQKVAARRTDSPSSYYQGRGASSGSSQDGPLFCSPGAPEEADFSTTATMPHESATVQQQHQQQRQQQGQQQQMQPHEHAQQLAASSWHGQQQLQMRGKEQGAPWVEERGPSVPLSVRLSRAVNALAAVFQLSLTATLVVAAVGCLAMLGYSLLWDILLQEQQRKAEAAAEAAACRQKHRENGCESLNPIPPFLRKPCEEWRACLMAVPEHHGETTKVAAQVLAQVLNAFFQSLHWRTIVAAAAFLWLSLYAYRTLSPASSHLHGAAGCASCSGSQQWGAPHQQAVGGARGPAALAAQQHTLALPQHQQQQHASMLLSDLGHELNVLKQQILRGSEPHIIMATLGRQDALQRELASVLHAEPPLLQQQQQQAAHSLQAGSSSDSQHLKQRGFVRSLISSWVFKFLVLLWVGYACVVGCMYALKHNLFEFQLEALEV